MPIIIVRRRWFATLPASLVMAALATDLPAQSTWLQVAAHTPGLHGSQWRTDLGLCNPGSSNAAVEVRFYPAGGGVALSQTTQVTSGAQAVLEDVVGQLGASGSGALEVISAHPIIVTSRTYSQIADGAACTPGGTFGQYYAGHTPSQTLKTGESAWLPHLAESSRFRSNVALTNTGANPATVGIELFDGAGTLLTAFSITLNPGQYKQETQAFKNRAGQTAMQRGSARVTVYAGSDVIASASVVDNTTNDPTTIPMIRQGGLAATNVWVQVGARNPGLHGSQWRTDLGLLNVGDDPAWAEVRFHPASGGSVINTSAQVPAGAQVVLENVVGQLDASGSGALEIVSAHPILVTSRTFNQIADGAACTPGGTFGQYYPAHILEQGLANGESAWLTHLAESSRFRSNIALTNMGTAEATVQVELFDGAGALLTTFTVALNPGQYRQETQVFKNRAGQTAMQRGSARVTVHAGSDVIASASVVDNTTNDPTTIPALTLAEQAITIMLPGNVPLVLRRIPGGTFMMGSPESERGRSADGREGPHHPVTLTQDYYLGEFEVTQEQWLALMGTNPSLMAACGLDCPVEQVSWDDICGGTTGSECLQTSFIGTLNAHLTATGQPGAGKFRLPTEAEWERAARAGTTTEFSFPAPPDWHLECGDFPAGDAHMWWCGNQPPYGTKQVGQKQPNAFGLYDMHGNVLEWVADWYGSYSSGGATDPTGPPTAMYRVARGGGFEHWAWLCRSAFRDPSPANNRNYILGFRLARSQ